MGRVRTLVADRRSDAASGPRRRRRSRRYDLGTALVWAGGVLLLVAVLFIAASGAQRWFGFGVSVAGELPPTHAPALPELAVSGGPGSAAQAQLRVRGQAEAFADCVFRAGGGAAPPPYASCDTGRAIGVDPAEISRRGAHGPIDGRGARRGLGLFTVHGGREAWLLQYDATGTGWGYAFDAAGNVEAQCRTRKGRLCWHLEDDPTGALFLGDRATAAVLAQVLDAGRAPR